MQTRVGDIIALPPTRALLLYERDEMYCSKGSRVEASSGVPGVRFAGYGNEGFKCFGRS